MSLVNDMLKDLETRWPHAEQSQSDAGIGGVHLTSQTAGNDESEIPRALSSKSKSGLGGGPWILVILGVAIFSVIVGGHHLWFINQTDGTQKHLSPLEKVLVAEESSTSATAQEIDPEEASVSAVAESGTATTRLLPETVVREGQTAANQVIAYRTPPTVDFLLDPEPAVQLKSIEERILGLMAEGDASLRIDRLTTPKEDNAYDRYMAVLALRPEHAQAQVGLEKVRSRYLEIVEIAIIKKYYYKVPELIRKAREIGVSQERIDALVAGLPEKDGKPTKEVLQRIAEYEASRGLDKRKTVNIEQNSLANDITAGNGETKAATNIVTSSLSQRDRTIAEEARKLISGKQFEAAQFLLEAFVESYPETIYAYRELFNLRLQQNKVPMAEAMIKGADHVPGEIFSYMVAQLLVHRKDYGGALRALNSQSPDMNQDLSYYALKAGVFHKLNQNDQAATTYRELLRIDIENPTYWLGLAVSLEAADKNGALAAFQKVQQLAEGSESFLPYVRNRIGVLASNR